MKQLAWWHLKKKERSVQEEPIQEKKPEQREQGIPKSVQIVFENLENPVGYIKLSDYPDVLIAVDRIADLVSNMTIQLMENTELGDKRVKNALARKIDVEPCRNMTRKAWIYKIVRDLLLDGDGNSIVHISVDNETGLIRDLTPLQMKAVTYKEGQYLMDYTIDYNKQTYTADEIIHFVLNPHPHHPWKGTSYRVSLRDVVKNIAQSNKTKNNFMSGKYMPSVILSVDAMAEELASKEGRDNILKKYVDETEGGKPWVLPADLAQVHQIKPLSLKDIAIIEGMEMDKKTIAGIMGVPAFILGVGSYNKDEYHNFINTRVMSIAQRIAQTLTRDLLYNEKWYFRLNPRSLYDYDITQLVSAGVQLVDRNALLRNELRNWLGLDPNEEMKQLLVLENYIKEEDVGNQKKLIQNNRDTDATKE